MTDDITREIDDAAVPGPENDPLWYDGEGDLLDTAEGRAKFCHFSKSSIYSKEDPQYPGTNLMVFCLQDKALVVKRRSRKKPGWYECYEFDAQGNLTNSFYDIN